MNQNDWGSWPQNHRLWSSATVIEPYIKNTGVFRCPDDSQDVDPGIAQATGPTRIPAVQSYMVNSFNHTSNNDTAFGIAAPQGVMTIGQTYGGTEAATNLATVPKPADTILLAEGAWDVNNWWCGSGSYSNTEVDWCWGTMSQVYADWLVNLIVLDPGVGFNGRITHAWRKHTGGANVAFTDGHVKMMRPADMLDPKRWLVNAQQ